MTYFVETSPRASGAFRLLPLLLIIGALAGCNSFTTQTRPADDASRTAAARAEPVREERAREPEAAAVAAPNDTGGLPSGLLAERRRGDYPQVETSEFGFTITEQLRIAGAARADYERALVLLDQQRFAEGIALLIGVTEAAPEITAPYVDLGIAYERSGDLDKARKTLETALLLSPDHPIVHNELGIVYRKAGRFAEARASYERALAVFADFHYARRNLGVLCDLYLADLDCALENYTAYINAVGEDPEVSIWVADIRNRLGQQGGM